MLSKATGRWKYTRGRVIVGRIGNPSYGEFASAGRLRGTQPVDVKAAGRAERHWTMEQRDVCNHESSAIHAASPSPEGHGLGQGDQRIVIRGVGWHVYDCLSEAIGEGQHVRLAYDGEDLEIMTTGHLHERYSEKQGNISTSGFPRGEARCETVPVGGLTS